MYKEAANLDDLRRRIDEIDDQIHDLLIERTEIVHGVAEVKNRNAKLSADGVLVPSLAMRPSREADIMRRLLGRHKGELPFHVIAQLWRELINAKTRLQGPLQIAMCHGSQDANAFRDLARASYGQATPLDLHDTANAVLEAVITIPGVIGILPAPTMGDAAPWWPELLNFDGRNKLGPPCIVALLPGVTGTKRGPDYPPAMTIACIRQEPSGDDTSLFVVRTSEGVTEDALVAAFAASGLKASVEGARAGENLILVAVPEYVSGEDERLANILAASDGILEIRSVGGYANPLKIDN